MKKPHIYLFLLLALHLFFLTNLKFTAWPEMLSYPYLLNNNFNLYTDFIHPYPPLLTLTLALIYKIFSYKLLTLQIFTWSIILISDLLIFNISKKLSKSWIIGLLSLGAYVIIQPFLQGNQLWFELALTPLLLTSFHLLLNIKNNNNILLAGLLLGLAALIKQTSALYLIFLIFYFLFKKNHQEIIKLLIFPTLLLILLYLFLHTTNSLSEFTNWVLIYPPKYFTNYPNYVQMSFTIQQLRILFILLLPIFLSLRALVKQSIGLLLLGFLTLSLVMVYPRFSFFHLQPFIALIPIAFALVLQKHGKHFVLATIYYILATVFVSVPNIKTHWRRPPRFYPETNYQISDTNIFLLGPHSNIYAFTNTLPPKPWTDNFGWYLEIPSVQNKIISKWLNNPPEAIYWQQNLNYQPEAISNWIKLNYTKKGKAWDNIEVWQRKN